jgi:bacterioferritin (cytochrome b1)
MLECGIQLENDVIDKYNKMISKIADMQDHATADILTEILREEVIHKEWLEAQLKVMREMGRQLYISKLVELDDEEEGSGGGKHHHH